MTQQMITLADFYGLKNAEPPDHETLDKDARKKAHEAAKEAGLKQGEFEKLYKQSFQDAFDIPLVDVFLNGWVLWRDLRIYAAGKPAASQKARVPVFEHAFASRHTPRIGIYWKGAMVHELELEAELALVVEGASLKVHRGFIWAVEGLSYHVRGTIGLNGVNIWENSTKKAALPAVVELAEGLEIPQS